MHTPDSSRRPSRRTALTLGTTVAASALLGACGPVRLGGPAGYTPPPVGIDDIYRPELLATIDELRSTVPHVVSTLPEVATQVRDLSAALVEQRQALLTGAEASGAASPSSASGSTGSGASASDGASSEPVPVFHLVDLLTASALLCADACVQCSGSLARVVGAIGAHHLWTAGRLAALSQDPSIPAPVAPAAADITPTRTVPDSDPPSVAATVDYQTELQETQGDEWYTGYVFEVLAARATDEAERTRLLDASTAHRDRARELATIAAQDSIASVLQEPVYGLPGGGDPTALDTLPPELSATLLTDWVALTGASPFARRATMIATAYAEAVTLSGYASALVPLPGLATDG